MVGKYYLRICRAKDWLLRGFAAGRYEHKRVKDCAQDVSFVGCIEANAIRKSRNDSFVYI